MFTKKIIQSLLFLVISVSAFSQAGVTTIDSIPSGGLYRKFRLYVPNIYNGSSARPLILNLHGYTSNAIQQQGYANFMPLADTANFIVVQPEGTAPLGSQYWNAGIGGTVNDVQFMSDLIDSLSLLYNIDANSVYSCGMSNGGIMSYYLACYLPGKIAAIASVTGSMLNSWFTCAPARPFPVMEIHGTADATVNYLGDATFAPIDSVVKKWRKHNNCNAAAVTYSVPNINLADNSTAVNYQYINGDNGSTVELYKVTGGSHSWPGAVVVIANTNLDFSATTEIWRFFRKYHLNQFVTGFASHKIELNNIKVYPNPANNLVMVEGIEEAELSIFAMDGKKVLYANKTNFINVDGINSGLYFLEIKNQQLNKRVKLVISSH